MELGAGRVGTFLGLKWAIVTFFVTGMLWVGNLEPALANDAISESFIEVPITTRINQFDYSEWACGPAAVLTLIANAPTLKDVYEKIPGASSSQKLEYVIRHHGFILSEDHEGRRHRFHPEQGISAVDLRYFSEDILNDFSTNHPLTGSYLDRTDEEVKHPGAYVRRIHQMLKTSLTAGVPVVVHLRSFSVGPDPKTSEPVWKGLSSHYGVITKIPAELKSYDLGFSFEYVDPAGGKTYSGYLSEENIHPFAAAKGNTEKWEWLSNSPYLLATLPAVGLEEVHWSQRKIFVLSYALGQFE